MYLHKNNFKAMPKIRNNIIKLLTPFRKVKLKEILKE